MAAKKTPAKSKKTPAKKITTRINALDGGGGGGIKTEHGAKGPKPLKKR